MRLLAIAGNIPTINNRVKKFIKRPVTKNLRGFIENSLRHNNELSDSVTKNNI